MDSGFNFLHAMGIYLAMGLITFFLLMSLTRRYVKQMERTGKDEGGYRKFEAQGRKAFGSAWILAFAAFILVIWPVFYIGLLMKIVGVIFRRLRNGKNRG